jgi:hypothetical protein
MARHPRKVLVCFHALLVEESLDGREVALEPGDASSDFFEAELNVAAEEYLVNFAFEQVSELLFVLARVYAAGGVARQVIVAFVVLECIFQPLPVRDHPVPGGCTCIAVAQEIHEPAVDILWLDLLRVFQTR